MEGRGGDDLMILSEGLRCPNLKGTLINKQTVGKLLRLHDLISELKFSFIALVF